MTFPPRFNEVHGRLDLALGSGLVLGMGIIMRTNRHIHCRGPCPRPWHMPYGFDFGFHCGTELPVVIL